MAQSNVTLIRPVKLLHNITRFFNHWQYRRGVLELSIFNSLECFPWKLLSYCTGPRNVLSYCTGPRKGVPGGTTFARWSPLKKYLAAILLFTLTEQMSKLVNLQNASHNKYTKLHLKTNTCYFEHRIQLWLSNFPTFS